MVSKNRCTVVSTAASSLVRWRSPTLGFCEQDRVTVMDARNRSDRLHALLAIFFPFRSSDRWTISIISLAAKYPLHMQPRMLLAKAAW